MQAGLRPFPPSESINGRGVGGYGQPLDYDAFVCFYLCEKALVKGTCSSCDIRYCFDLLDEKGQGWVGPSEIAPFHNYTVGIDIIRRQCFVLFCTYLLIVYCCLPRWLVVGLTARIYTPVDIVCVRVLCFMTSREKKGNMLCQRRSFFFRFLYSRLDGEIDVNLDVADEVIALCVAQQHRIDRGDRKTDGLSVMKVCWLEQSIYNIP